MKKVTIVTDGINDLPKNLIEKYDISIVPYRVIFVDDIYQVCNNDETTIPREEFLKRLANSPKDAFVFIVILNDLVRESDCYLFCKQTQKA